MSVRDCRSIRGSLVAYLDGEIDGAARGAVDEHLRICVDCPRELDELRRMTLLVRDAFSEEPAADEQWREALGRAKGNVAALRLAPRPIPAFFRRVAGHPLGALAATIVVSVAVGEVLDLLGLREEGIQVLSYVLSLSLS